MHTIMNNNYEATVTQLQRTTRSYQHKYMQNSYILNAYVIFIIRNRTVSTAKKIQKKQKLN